MAYTPGDAEYLDTIRVAIRARLVEILEMDESRVLLVRYDRRPPAILERVVTIYVGGPMPWQEGAGRGGKGVARELTIRMYTRLSVDPSSDDTVYLTDEELGHDRFEHLVLDALDGWMPNADALHSLVAEPFWHSGGEGLAPVGSGGSADPGFGSSAIKFGLRYVLPLTQRDPPWS